jgi:hypothetical protein
MALDFTLLYNNKIIKSIPIGVDGHFYLIEVIKKLGNCPLMQRTGDYYGDAEIKATELSLLLQEIDSIRNWEEKEECREILREIEKITEWDLRQGIKEFLHELKQLVHEAIQLNISLKVIAD